VTRQPSCKLLLRHLRRDNFRFRSQDFKPFLEDLTQILGRQYVLTFQAKLGPKPGYKRIQITTELSGARIIAPAHVYLPAR